MVYIMNMFLNKKSIQQLVADNKNFISPFNPKLLKPASYTFRLGGIPGQSQPEGEDIVLEPGEFINLESLERIEFPDDIVGILSTRGSIAKQGLDCLLSSTVIEPGSKGKQTFETKNHSNQTVILKVGQPIVKCLFPKIG